MKKLLKNKTSIKDFQTNIQLFADSFEGIEEGVTNPILDDGVEGTNTDAEETSTEEPNGDITEDENIEIEPQVNEGFSEIKSQLDSILEKINSSQETEEEAEETEEEVKLTEEEIEKMNNDFYLEFTERPLEALQKLIDEEANKKVAPVMEYFNQIQQVETHKQEIEEFEKANPDFKEYIEDVSRIIQEDEGIRTSKNPLDVAYKLAKAERLQQELAEKDKPIEETLKDKETLNKLLQNKDIKNLIIKELMEENKGTPNVIGSNGGGTTINVGDKPKTIEEATKAWLNQ